MNTVTIIALFAIALFVISIVAITIFKKTFMDIKINVSQTKASTGVEFRTAVTMTAKKSVVVDHIIARVVRINTETKESAPGGVKTVLSEVELAKNLTFDSGEVRIFEADQFVSEGRLFSHEEIVIGGDQLAATEIARRLRQRKSTNQTFRLVVVATIGDLEVEEFITLNVE